MTNPLNLEELAKLEDAIKRFPIYDYDEKNHHMIDTDLDCIIRNVKAFHAIAPILATLVEKRELATGGEWKLETFQSGTVAVSVRKWIGPKSQKYGYGYMSAHISAYNIDHQSEKEIDREKYNNGIFIEFSANGINQIKEILSKI